MQNRCATRCSLTTRRSRLATPFVVPSMRNGSASAAGMMLAEVGPPPGADVDRASLDAELSSSRDVQSYEIQPDHVVVYLWPHAGGTSFSFSLKARLAMRAQSAEFILYDYYNPEARASVPPALFVVQ